MSFIKKLFFLKYIFFAYLLIASIWTNAYGLSNNSINSKTLIDVSFADEDGDGVEDENDACPGTLAGDTVDSSGCSQAQKDDDSDGITNDLDECPTTPPGQEVDSSGCSIICNIELFLLNGPQYQTVQEGESITEVYYEFESDCYSLDFNIDGLPNGVYFEVQDNYIVIKGQAEDLPGIYPYTLSVIKSLDTSSVGVTADEVTEASIKGEITVTGNTNSETGSNTQECIISLELFEGPQSQIVSQGESITEVVYEFETDCSRIDINVIGLPNGVYWEGKENKIVIRGQAEDSTGSYIYTVNLLKTGENTASDEVTEASIKGEITVTGNTNSETGSNTQECIISLELFEGPQSQIVSQGESITEVAYEFETDCSEININVIGLPNGVNWEGKENKIVIRGQAEDSTGSYIYTVNLIKTGENTATDEVTEASIKGEIFIEEYDGDDDQDGDNDGNNDQDNNQDGDGNENGDQGGQTYETENGCLITIANLPKSGETSYLCSADYIEFKDDSDRVVDISISSTCSDSNISGEITGLPDGWSYSLRNDNNNTILSLILAEGEYEGTYDLNFMISDSSNSFQNETVLTLVFGDYCEDEGPDGNGNENDGDQVGNEDESELVGTYQTENGCEITIMSYNLYSGEIWEECVGDEPSESYRERFVVSSTCSDSNISVDITGLPSGWYTTLSLDSQNNTILEMFPGDNVSNIGTYDLNLIITESSSNFTNETSFTLVISSDCEDIDESDSENDNDDGQDGNNNSYNSYQTENGCKIEIYGLPQEGNVAEICFLEYFSDQIIVLSNCADSNISGEATGLPPGWYTEISNDGNNGTILSLFSGEEQSEGTYDVNLIITDSSNNFKNETNMTFDLSQEYCDVDLFDYDEDGVPDKYDECPETAKGDNVDESGCSRDQSYNDNIGDYDNDGVSDAYDACPETPEGVPTDEYGCSKEQSLDNDSVNDDDGDGIINFNDACPETEVEYDIDGNLVTKIDEYGCSLDENPAAGTFIDSDSDGIPDEYDECPETKEGADVTYFGCSADQTPGESDSDDNDNDGVLNYSDNCPNTPEGLSVDFFGCSVDETEQDNLEDSDSDGIPDFYDACPETARDEVVNAFGCAEGQTREEGAVVDSDEDGIPDVYDACPKTEDSLSVNQYGCSEDQTPEEGTYDDLDSDGVPDEFDECPETKLGTSVNEYGCPLDDNQDTKTFIPDNAFEQTLIDLGLDDLIDNYVETEPLQYIEYLNLSSSERSDRSKITDLTGLEAFAGLVELIVSGNNLFFIDTYWVPYLRVLNADDNLISEINTFDIPNLEKLSINNNLLNYIDVSGNSSLNYLDIGNNDIYSEVDFNNNFELSNIRLNNTSIQSIDISSLINLEKLEAINTDINCINVSEDQFNEIPEGWKINGDAFYSTECGYVNDYDEDYDGVLNEDDQCPDTPSGQQVDLNGCSRVDSDSDLDGIIDEFDKCPNTPENSIVNEFGCTEKQIDNDLDGVLNEFDECPESPIGIAVNESGCSEKEEQDSEDNSDDDRDGIINVLDRCPETRAGTIVDEYGCTPSETVEQTEVDNDHDGVLNEDDLCPDTGFGLAVNSLGCPLNELDSDFDKVFDDLDLCPNTESGVEVDQYGCSLSQKDNDSDLDGVENDKDYCLNTPPYSIVNSNGCSAAQIAVDSDFDGVNNSNDQCPNTLPFEAVNEYGCSDYQQDDDKDGVFNGLDRCTQTPEGVKVDEYGCAQAQIDGDDDQDGILNSIDQCPETLNGQEVDPNGCVFLAPKIQSQTFQKTENSRDSIATDIREYIGKVIVEDPNAEDTGDISNIRLEIISSDESDLFEIKNDSIFLVGRTDFETKVKHSFQIRATNNRNLTNITNMVLDVLNIPNTNTVSNFELAVFDNQDESISSKVDYKRYLNPNITKGVGKWKIKKKISGGADAALFEIKTAGTDFSSEKSDESESDDYLVFKSPPDFENPQDHDQDNIYEVEVVNINTNDGESAKPISVTQTNLVVPEGNATAIQLQTVSAAPLDDTDGDGIVDILDNSPLVFNPNQEDSDLDGVGDVSDDQDHDGVWDPFDTCADTPYGKLVDINGCSIFYLPPSNFSLSKTEKCQGTNSIGLSVQDTSLTYQINISGVISQTQTLTSSSWSLENLSQGSYSICITVDGIDPSEFKRCFDVTINEPESLSVYSSANKTDQTVSYKLSGGQNYSITHNGVTEQTTDSEYTICLDKGVNTVSITTGIACQGIFEQAYFNSDTVVTAPNPFNENLAVFVGGKELNANIEIYSNNGRTILVKQYSLTRTERTIYIDTSSLISGSYIVKVSNASVNQSQIVIKE